MSYALNREEWLTTGANIIADWYRAHGYAAKDVRASCSWPVGHPHSCMGEVWHPDQALDGRWYVHINPVLSDSITVLAALAHEVAHTIDFNVNHRGVFLKAVRQIGLVGLARTSEAGPRFHTLANRIIDNLGQYPFKGLKVKWRNTRKKVVSVYNCTGCGYIAMVPQKQASYAQPLCAMPTCSIYRAPLIFKEQARI